MCSWFVPANRLYDIDCRTPIRPIKRLMRTFGGLSRTERFAPTVDSPRVLPTSAMTMFL